jgi:plastocyanin
VTILRARRSPAGLVGALLLVAFTACGGSGGTPVPQSAACAVADASNTVQLTAKDLKFSASCMQAAAGKAIVIHFTNDETIPHDVAVYTDSSKAQELGRSKTVTGPNASTSLTIGSQGPGQLYFECTIHNAMNGALVVKASPGAS